MERLQNITKTRGADKCENMSKRYQHAAQIHEKWPRSSTKTMLKNIAQKNKKYLKHDSQIGPKK